MWGAEKGTEHLIYSGSHDIAHCGNTKCEKRLRCTRYIAHLDAIRRGIIYLSYFSPEYYDEMVKDCDKYWPDEENLR
jgi:hypothetical protein